MSYKELTRQNRNEAFRLAGLIDDEPLFGGRTVVDLDDYEQDEQDFIFQGYVEYEDGSTDSRFTLTYHGVA